MRLSTWRSLASRTWNAAYTAFVTASLLHTANGLHGVAHADRLSALCHLQHAEDHGTALADALCHTLADAVCSPI